MSRLPNLAVHTGVNHGVLAERIFGVANFLPVLPSADTRVYLKKNFRFKVSSFDSSVVERLASMRGNPRSIPAHSKNIFCSESSLISLGNSQLQVIIFSQAVSLEYVPKNGRLALLRIIGEEVFLPISCGMYFEAKLALERE